MASLSHLPAYAAVGRWVAGRRVVVVGPAGLDGPARLLASDAWRVILVGQCPWAPSPYEVRQGIPELPLPDGDADVVVCIEPYSSYAPALRRQVVREAHRVLRSGGVFAAWVPRRPLAESDADFWALEAELGEVFAGATMVAQIPWQGVSLAPVLDDERIPNVALEETLLQEVPEASHYLAIGFRDRAPTELLDQLRSQCLLVPIPGPQQPASATTQDASSVEPPLPRAESSPRTESASPPPSEQRLSELRAQLESRDTDIRVLTTNVETLEQSLARASERAEGRARELEAVQKERRELHERCTALASERDAVANQVQIATAERAGARQLADRVEAELDQARRRLAEHTAQFAERTAEASRLAGELQAVRERLNHQEAALDKTRSQAEELTRTAARQDEQSRMLAEVASDRDRLREELKRRADAITSLEERVWMAREDVQKERLESVRLAAEVERLRDHAERAREAETDGRARIEALSAEVRKVELERADAQALLRSRQEEIARLHKDAEALGSEFADIDQLRVQLTERGRALGEVQEQLERARSRSAESAQLIKRREEQLSRAGDELQALRHQLEQSAGQASSLQSDLEVRALEVEQLAASVANLQGQLEEQRRARRQGDDATGDLQRRLELATEDLDQMRNRLREREQELADVVSAKETHGVELYKLRQELEAASHVNEQLEEALKLDPRVAATSSAAETGWPDDAVAETRRLRGQLAAQTRRHAEQLARIERERVSSPSEDDLMGRVRAAELEADVRADEQGHLLTLLEAAEQKIWEMNDASDRNAARLAASLAQLEMHKEQLDETFDELEVTRSLLGAAQSRALEQERLVASERAKLMRAGIDPDGLPNVDTGHEDPFAGLESSELMIELHVTADSADAPGVPAGVISDRSGSGASSSPGSSPASSRLEGPRMVVEAVDDDEWDGEGTEGPASTARRGTGTAVTPRPPTIGAPNRMVVDPTMPSLRLPPPPTIGSAKAADDPASTADEAPESPKGAANSRTASES